MAIVLLTSVIRGEIDNTESGCVRGRLWLMGREQPVELRLLGNPWRDAAGMRITFRHPSPTPERDTLLLSPVQEGSVGDITISRRVKHFNVMPGEKGDGTQPAFEWRNGLYLEWFSHANARVLIEGDAFEITVSEPVWEMDEADEQAQQLTNLHAMRNYLANVIQRSEDTDEDFDPDFDNESEEAWEEHLQESDRLGKAHEEAIEKYGFELESQDKISFVMGWDHLLDGGDSEEEEPGWIHEVVEGEEWKDDDDLLEGDLETEEQVPFRDREADSHPLCKRTFDFSMLVLDLTEAMSGDVERKSKTGEIMDEIARNCLNISGKIAGVLSNFYSDLPMPRGMILATLKRCEDWGAIAQQRLAELQQTGLAVEQTAAVSTELATILEEIRTLRAELGGV